MRDDASNVVGADGDRIEHAAEMFRALASPVRLRILLSLTEGERTVQQLADALGITQPHTSQHLRVLREVGLVRVQVSGRRRIHAVADEHVSHIVLDAITHTEEHHG